MASRLRVSRWPVQFRVRIDRETHELLLEQAKRTGQTPSDVARAKLRRKL